MIAAWMIYSIVVSIPITLGALALSTLLRRHGVPERGIWIAALLLAVAVPVFGLLPATSSGVAPMGAVALDLGLPEVVELGERGVLAGLSSGALVLWMGLSALLGLGLLRSVRRLALKSRGWATEVRAGTAVLVSDDVGPAVFGLWRPTVILPVWMWDLPEDQLGLIVRHEVEHIRAGDPWAVGFLLVMRVAAPWHPGVWLLTAGLRQAIEIDCDRRVLVGHRDVRGYGETVLVVAARMRPGPAQPVAAFTESVRFIKRRLLVMTQPQRRLGRYGVLGVAALAAVVLVGACETPLPSFSPEEPLEVETVYTGSVEIPAPADASLQAEAEVADPSFTPFTVAPSITNQSEMVTKMEENYPPLLRDAGIGGTIKVYVFVDEAGVVQDRRIHESSGHQALDDAAMRVAREFRFSPALNRDTPVGVWVSFPITFQPDPRPAN